MDADLEFGVGFDLAFIIAVNFIRCHASFIQRVLQLVALLEGLDRDAVHFGNRFACVTLLDFVLVCLPDNRLHLGSTLQLTEIIASITFLVATTLEFISVVVLFIVLLLLVLICFLLFLFLAARDFDSATGQEIRAVRVSGES